LANIDLINSAQFKLLSSEDRKNYLRERRKIYSDKTIRNYWEMTHGSYRYYIKSLGLEVDDEKNMTLSEKSKNIIEADFHVYEEEKNNETQLAIPESKEQTVPNFPPMINFPEAVGTVTQLRKRLEGILMVLESENEDQLFKLKIEVSLK
jgi:hypothetical protein